MAKEIERKFLVKDGIWRSRVDASFAIRQFYLASGRDRSIRVRIHSGAMAAILTLKFGIGAVRDEFEYPISLQEAEDMERFALGRIVEKTRHHVRHAGWLFEVDEFSGDLAGLVLAELETADAVPPGALPNWLGREVTGDPAFNNASLALHGQPVMDHGLSD